VGLESGTVSFFVSRQLERLGLRPIVIDAREVRAKAHRPNQKCDGRDALEICGGIRSGQYRSVVHVPPLAISALRDTLSRRRHFIRHQTSEVNAVKRLVRSAGLRPAARTSLRTERGWSRLLALLDGEEELAAHVELHQEAWRCAKAQAAAEEALLEVQARPFQDQVRRLETVPGVGRIVALTVLAVLSDVRRFPTSKHAASYAGLVPSTYQSGDRDHHGRITRRGSAELRAMLCEAAHHARRPEHPLNPYFRALTARRGYKMAVVAVAHRLCRILYSMLRHGADFDVEKLGVEIGPFETSTSRLYRRRRRPTATA
jgi:transposase